MPHYLRKQLKNHFLLGFVPFGGSIKDFIVPILEDIHRLEHGIIMQMGNEEVWVVGGLGCITADLPQGNDLAGVKRHNANHGCRTCFASSAELTDGKYDIIANDRFRQLTNKPTENSIS